MNPLLLQFVNGNGFFAGLALVISALSLRLRFQGRFSRPILTVLAIVGSVIVAISGTPISIWFYGLWGASFLWTLVVLEIKSLEKFKRSAFTLILLTSMFLGITEIPHLLAPTIHISKGQRIFVIGDSISAGMGTKETNWPDVMAKRYGLNVANLAAPGATTESASNQASRIKGGSAVVIVEIGGNDFFGNDDSKLFASCLENLLSGLRQHGHSIFMFELPLPPFYNRYGEIQRALAKKYGATLIPKRFMTHVFGIPDATRDGLHLSQKGHDAMAGSVYGLMKVGY